MLMPLSTRLITAHHAERLCASRKAAGAAAAAAADAGAPAAAAALLHSSLGAAVRTQYAAGLAGQLAGLARRRARAGGRGAGPDPAPALPGAGGPGAAVAASGRGEDGPATDPDARADAGQGPDLAPAKLGKSGRAAALAAAGAGGAPASASNSAGGGGGDEAQRGAWLRASAVLAAAGAWMRDAPTDDLPAVEVQPACPRVGRRVRVGNGTEACAWFSQLKPGADAEHAPACSLRAAHARWDHQLACCAQGRTLRSTRIFTSV